MGDLVASVECSATLLTFSRCNATTWKYLYPGTGYDNTIGPRSAMPWSYLVQGSCCTEDTLDITSLLHRNNTCLILLIDPKKEGLCIIVENATFHTSNSKISVSTHEKEVVINKLLTNLLIHTSKRIIFTSKITSKLGKSIAHKFFNTNTLLFGDSRGETKSINVTANTDTSGMNWDVSINISSDLRSIHVRGMLGSGTDSMVLLNNSIEDLSKVLVGIPISSIDTAVLVIKLNSTGTCLGKGKVTGLGLDVLHFVPPLLGHMLGHQGAGGLDSWEFSRHGLYSLDLTLN